MILISSLRNCSSVRSKYCTPIQETSIKWVPRSKSGAPKTPPVWWHIPVEVLYVSTYRPGPNKIGHDRLIEVAAKYT